MAVVRGQGGGWGSGRESYGLIGTELQFEKRENILEMDGGDGCTTVYVLNATE